MLSRLSHSEDRDDLFPAHVSLAASTHDVARAVLIRAEERTVTVRLFFFSVGSDGSKGAAGT